MCVFVCVFVKQQKKKTTNSFCGCHGCLFFFVMPIVYHRHTHIQECEKANTHTSTSETNTLKAFNVFFIEGATAILIPIANPMLSFASPCFCLFLTLGALCTERKLGGYFINYFLISGFLLLQFHKALALASKYITHTHCCSS